MAAQCRRVQEAQVLAGDVTQPLREAWDAGAYRVIEVLFDVLTAGSAGTLRLQHAAVNEEAAYVDLAGASVSLSSGGKTFIEVTKFLRFVRWKADGGVAGNPASLVDAIAKE